MSERKPSQRFHSLNTEQVEVLHQVLSEVVPIHGRGNFPTLELRPRDIIIAVRARLQKQGITVRDVRLNGSTASHVLVRDNGTSYKDLDIIFGVELPSQEEFQVIKESVLGCLLDCLPAGVNRERISSATMKEAYVQKMVKVFNEHDRWSLISLSNNSGKNLELKFVSVLRRQFEFSVDSFQIILDRLLESYMQQETQHKMNTVELKEEAAESQSAAAAEPDKSGPGNESAGGEEAGISRTQQRDEVQQKESQTETSKQSEHSRQEKHSTPEKDNKEETPAEMKEVSEQREESDQTEQTSLNLLSKKRQTSEKAEPPAQTELTHEPELLDENECSAKAEQAKPEDGRRPARSNHKQLSVEKELADQAKPPDEREELAEQMGRVETPTTSKETQGESLDLAAEACSTEQSRETNASPCPGDGDETQHVSAPDTNASPAAATEPQSADESRAEPEICEETQAASETDTNELQREISATEVKPVEDAPDPDCSCSVASALTLCNTLDTPEIHSTQHTENSEKPPNTLDAVSPPNTQDILPTPPSLVSDKKTSSSSSPSSKASERLSHMVVLKHSSPKPPRRMCRKVAPSPGPVPDSELAACVEQNSCLSPESELALDVKPTAPSSSPTTPPTAGPLMKVNCELEPDPSDDPSSNLDFTSAPDPAPDIPPTAAVDPVSTLPQEPASSQLTAEGSCEAQVQSPADVPGTDVSPGEEGPSSPCENASRPKQSEPVDSGDALVSHTDPPSSNTQEPVHTSAAELSDEAEDRTDQNVDVVQPNSSLQEAEQSPSSSSQCVTPPVSCLTPPVLSLSPPCFTPSPQSLSPPPCLTPPSHCLSASMLNTVSPATSFSSPPLSFSPTSSCLSSPPYLTPPMLSLSPPPLCLTPPSPCLSPPLLCLTPPVESEDLVPQVSSDLEPLILNTDGDEQIKEASAQAAAPLLQLEDEKEPDYISSLPQVSEPVSFPITIPSSTSQVLPHSQPGDSGESAPPKAAAEASTSAPESAEAPRVSAEQAGKSDATQAPDSVPDVEVLAESMYGDFEAAMDHLRYRLIATRNPEEIRGGGLLKYSNLLVRDYRPASETQIKTLERYMCSRFFIDFPDVQEQQRKILSYLKNHFIGEERSKYQYLMTLRRVVDDSTVCLMGHERRQTLNMITVLALKVLGEQNIIPNTDHVTCFYQPAPYLAEHTAPYLAEPSYCSYYIPQGGSTLLYQPYPLHLHPQTGLV